jgi:hypothetical protein
MANEIDVTNPMQDEAVVAAYTAWGDLLGRRQEVANAIEGHETLSGTLGISASHEKPDWKTIEATDKELRANQRALELLDEEIAAAWTDVLNAWTAARNRAIEAGTAELASMKGDIEAAFEQARMLAGGYRARKQGLIEQISRQGPEEMRKQPVLFGNVPYPYGYHAHLK